MGSPRRLLRWAPPVVILAVVAGALAVLWTGEVDHRQGRTIQTLSISLLALVLLTGWFAFFSPFPARVRGTGLLAVAGTVGAFFALFRIDGTTGDFVPVVRFRWATPPSVKPAERASESADALPAASFPRFLGPDGNGVVGGVDLDPDWEARPPRLLWRRPVGAGWSGMSVAAGRVFTQEQDGPDEIVSCYDLATGEPLWRHADPARYETGLGGLGPRATPTLADGRVYALGATGILNVLDAATGRRAWTADLTKDTAARGPEWGYAGSPLVDGGRVIVQAGDPAGATLVAYDRGTGKLLWKAGTDEASYASPWIFELGGERQVVMLNHASCTGHDPATGRVLWRHPWRGSQPKVAQPVAVGGDTLVISAGYHVGADAFRVVRSGEGWSAAPVWTSDTLRAKFANFVHRDGALFGLSDGRLDAVDASTGDRLWKGGRYGHGQLLLAGRHLVILGEEGEVALVDADPGEFRERARLAVLDRRTWNSPALAGRLLLIRNDAEMACLELPGVAP